MKAIERQKISEEKQRAAEIKHKPKEQEKISKRLLVTRSKSRCATQAKIDNDVCMLCFVNYTDESGTQARDWIQCISCKRWMH